MPHRDRMSELCLESNLTGSKNGFSKKLFFYLSPSAERGKKLFDHFHVCFYAPLREVDVFDVWSYLRKTYSLAIQQLWVTSLGAEANTLPLKKGKLLSLTGCHFRYVFVEYLDICDMKWKCNLGNFIKPGRLGYLVSNLMRIIYATLGQCESFSDVLRILSFLARGSEKYLFWF